MAPLQVQDLRFCGRKRRLYERELGPDCEAQATVLHFKGQGGNYTGRRKDGFLTHRLVLIHRNCLERPSGLPFLDPGQ